MFDYDNDADLDIVATNGYYAGPTVPHGFEDDVIRLFRNNGQGGVLTTFTDVAAAAGMTDASQGRGLLTFDYDRDGDLDVFIVNNFQAPVLYRNDGGNEGDWLQIEAIGTLSNADGVGAFITVTPDLSQPNKKLVHENSGSSSFLSQSEPIAHFGLGVDAEPIDLIRIEWPASGSVQELRNVAPNQFLTVVERFPADFDEDGDVDGADFLTWQRSLGAAGTPTTGDANGDRQVTGQDLTIWRRQVGMPAVAAAGAVPEPALLTMTALAGVVIMARGRRRVRRARAFME
jgi:hypothetical protein